MGKGRAERERGEGGKGRKGETEGGGEEGWEAEREGKMAGKEGEFSKITTPPSPSHPISFSPTSPCPDATIMPNCCVSSQCLILYFTTHAHTCNFLSLKFCHIKF